jgi:hypothetical protein
MAMVTGPWYRARHSNNQRTAMSFVIEFWRFLRARKKYWLIPMIVMLALFGGLIVLAQGSAVAPFIYTIF